VVKPRPHPPSSVASTSGVTCRRRPSNLGAVGRDAGRPFPWVVSDFGLIDAIESGLVKVPQLACATRPARSARPTLTSGSGSCQS